MKHRPYDIIRTRFVRANPRRLAVITDARDGKESQKGLRGKVAFPFVPNGLLKKRTIARASGVSLQLVSGAARISVTQKPTRLVISWRQRNSR
ncbi:hypothetical protein NLM27_38930 [Bradyrhizobium sp. CCGB12]|uniref:hypothetical protein n=1 Tax=Bradyrhizobium sp. CCGB12 TaxID=2949632 RepID=UPI0020B32EC9|nr:hypothetical protein [Bradyrhizobium sp. CCGB12]MCP3394732.1 hypothetical protein [Bradyrhizobium sp. CCGB12]